MKTTKVFQHGGSQAVRIPKAFRFETSEVEIEKQGNNIVLKPVPKPTFESFAEIASHLESLYPDPVEFPAPPPRPGSHERPAPEI